MNSTFDRFERACYVNYNAISGLFKSGTVNHIQVFFTVDEEKYAKRKTVTMVMREGTLYAIESISTKTRFSFGFTRQYHAGINL